MEASSLCLVNGSGGICGGRTSFFERCVWKAAVLSRAESLMGAQGWPMSFGDCSLCWGDRRRSKQTGDAAWCRDNDVKQPQPLHSRTHSISTIGAFSKRPGFAVVYLVSCLGSRLSNDKHAARRIAFLDTLLLSYLERQQGLPFTAETGAIPAVSCHRGENVTFSNEHAVIPCQTAVVNLNLRNVRFWFHQHDFIVKSQIFLRNRPHPLFIHFIYCWLAYFAHWQIRF